MNEEGVYFESFPTSCIIVNSFISPLCCKYINIKTMKYEEHKVGVGAYMRLN